jgi:DNA polymerase III subunit epsilon
MQMPRPTPDRRLALAQLAAAALLGALLLATVGMLLAVADPVEVKIAGLVASYWPVLLLPWLLASLIAAAALLWAQRRLIGAPAQLAEQARALLGGHPGLSLQPAAAPEQQALAEVIRALADQRDALRDEMDSRVSAASERIEIERNQLSSLMAELNQSVVVCNRDGEILLYNQRARLQFQTLSKAPQLAAGAELIGIGRSIYAVLDRRLLEHALESLQRRLAHGAEQPTMQLLTPTRSGHWLRVQIAAVRRGATARGEPMSGFVLMLDNVTADFAAQQARERELLQLCQDQRSALGNLQAALEMLELPDLEPAMRERFGVVVQSELEQMSQLVARLGTHLDKGPRTRWPLEQVLGAEFLAAGQRRLSEMGGAPVEIEAGSDDSLWLKLDGYSLIQLLGHLHQRLGELTSPARLGLRLGPSPMQGRAQLDLLWVGAVPDAASLSDWLQQPMQLAGERLLQSVNEVLERHQGELWLARDETDGRPMLRCLLPLAEGAPVALMKPLAERPEYYDFDLFAPTPGARAMAEQPLGSLRFVVFDTETTGLHPDSGDQIIQIGAVRIVNGKLLHNEAFEQLIDPGRPPSPASVAIHGISAEQLARCAHGP